MNIKWQKTLLAGIAVLWAALLVSSCSGDENREEGDVSQEDTSLYPTADNSTSLTGSEALRMITALDMLGDPKKALNLDNINIGDGELGEIALFTNELVNGCSSAAEKYGVIFEWTTKNVKYEYSDNEAYTVFVTRKAICQGYSNLLKVMLYTQGIPAINVYGYLGAYGAHAWVYAFTDKWIVSDPTNGSTYDVKNVAAYKEGLIATVADVVIAEDEHFEYSYYEKRLTVTKVKETDSEVVVVPYSVDGHTISSFNPRSPLPKNVRAVYLGKNIISMGVEDIGLKTHGSMLKNVYVQSGSQAMENYKGVIYALSDYNNEGSYSKSGSILYIQPMLGEVELKPTAVIGKNVITNHMGIKKLTVPSGVKRIEAYAVENCPNLEEAIVPESTEVDENAFYGVSQMFRIIRK